MLDVKKITDGVFYREFFDSKFKFNIITVSFILKLTEDTAAKNVVLASVLRRCCKKYSNDLKMGEKLRSLYGANLFCDVKKAGNKQIIVFGIEVLDDAFAFEKEQLTKEAVSLLVEILFNPKIEKGKFSEEEVEIEKKDLKNLIKGIYSDKKQFALYTAIKTLFCGKDVAVFKYGNLEKVDEVNFKNLVESYNNLILNSDVLITASGARKNDGFLDLLFNKFKSLKRSPLKIEEPSYFVAEKKEKQDEDFLTQSKLVVCFKKETSLNNYDFEEEILITVLNCLFGGSATSLLFTNVREKQSLCYYCSSKYDPFLGVIFVESGVSSLKIEKTYEAILEQLNAIKRGEFSETDLKRAKYVLESAFKTVFDSEAKISGYFLNGFLKKQNKDLKEYLKQLSKIKKQDIVKTANKFHNVLKYVLKERGKTR